MGVHGIDNKKVSNHPMKFIDIYYDISAELPQQPGLKLIEIELNKVIRMINDTLGLWRELTDVSTGTLTSYIEAVASWDNNIEDTTLFWNEAGRFNMDWNWDSDEKRLTMSDNVVELMGVYIDNVEWEYKSYQEVSDSDNSSEKIYNQTGRFVYFPVDLDSETTTFKLDCKKNYSFVNIAVDGEDFGQSSPVDLPEAYRQLLISGVVMALTLRPKFKDPDLYAHNKEIFDKEYMELKDRYNYLETTTPQLYDKIYKY
jgi:hypothetical protein